MKCSMRKLDSNVPYTAIKKLQNSPKPVEQLSGQNWILTAPLSDTSVFNQVGHI